MVLFEIRWGAKHVELKNCRPGLISNSSASALCGALMLSFKKRLDLRRLDLHAFATLVQDGRMRPLEVSFDVCQVERPVLVFVHNQLRTTLFALVRLP